MSDFDTLPDAIRSTLNAANELGRVGCPAGLEANSELFHFWVPSDALVEKTQLITCRSEIAGEKLTFYAIINEVFRSSRKRSMGQEFDESDGDLHYAPPFQSEGCTYAEAAILRTEPSIFTPPRERSEVLLATAEDADFAYYADEVKEKGTHFPVGLVRNGGRQTLGPGYIDLDYLLGTNGGHMNVNGAAGRGTKSSFLMFVNWMLWNRAIEQKRRFPSGDNNLRVVPIILNVKGKDLFFIDRASRRYAEKEAQYRGDWEKLGVEHPVPFSEVEFFAPQQKGSDLSIKILERGNEVKPYSWSLRDIVEKNLLLYLFADEDAAQANFAALVYDIIDLITDERIHNDGTPLRALRTGPKSPFATNPPTFKGFLQWLRDESDEPNMLGRHSVGTVRKLYRRLYKLLHEGKGVLRYDEEHGHPLNVEKQDTCGPLVIDLSELSGTIDIQRFVVATILRQLVEARTGTGAVSGLRYLVTLDELNRFAPRGSRDPITQLIELVAAEMRSQGIILLGAQQQASKVSDRVIENSAIRVLGKSGSLEMSQPVWRFLSDAARRKAETLLPDEKMIVQDNFREPMHVRVPFPAWAMNREEAMPARQSTLGAPSSTNGHVDGFSGPIGLVDDFSDIIDE
jgi:DNA helicase HerA-like ATPase